jgi:hypothetical protein
MMLDLTQEETDALVKLLSRAIDDNRYPLSPCIQMPKAILSKIRPEPAREPLPPPKVYAPPRNGCHETGYSSGGAPNTQRFRFCGPSCDYKGRASW